MPKTVVIPPRMADHIRVLINEQSAAFERLSAAFNAACLMMELPDGAQLVGVGATEMQVLLLGEEE